MTDLINTIYGFLSQFGVPVYLENGIPEGAVLPYMTWAPTLAPWDAETFQIPVRLWRRASGYEGLVELTDKIGAALGESVTLKAGTSGYVYLCKGTPWAQAQPLDQSDVKVMYLNLGVATIIK